MSQPIHFASHAPVKWRCPVLKDAKNSAEIQTRQLVMAVVDDAYIASLLFDDSARSFLPVDLPWPSNGVSDPCWIGV